ncbi:MAG: arginyltransferase [Bdellovibrionales bacterium]
MSIIPPGLALDLQFFLSGPLPCPYLPVQVERKLFTRLCDNSETSNAEINGALCRAGFRRSQDIVYRPACNDCNACVPVRVPVQLFSPSRSLRRIEARNRDLHLQSAPVWTSAELFDLFLAYQKIRHGDSDMAHMDENDFEAMLKEGRADTHLYCLRDDAGVLKGCMVADSVGDGFSAVYSFFTPVEPRRSLGTMLILSLIEEARKQHLPFVYLGFWIRQARKMAYKSRFRPMQFLGPNGWSQPER